MYYCGESYLTSHLRCPERLTSGYCTPSDSEECSESESDYEEYEGDSPYSKEPSVLSQKRKDDTASLQQDSTAAAPADTKELDTEELGVKTSTGQGEEADRIWREHFSLVLSLPTTPDINVENIALMVAQHTYHQNIGERIRQAGMKVKVTTVEKNYYFLKEMALAILVSLTEQLYRCESDPKFYEDVLATIYMFHHLSLATLPLLDHSWSNCFRLISCYRSHFEQITDVYRDSEGKVFMGYAIDVVDTEWRSWCEEEPETLFEEYVRKKANFCPLLQMIIPNLESYIVPSLRQFVEAQKKKKKAEQMDRFAMKRLKTAAAKNAAAEARYRAYEKQKVEAKREKAAKLLHYEKCRKKKSKEEEEEQIRQLAEFHNLRLQRYFEGAKKEQEQRREELMSLSQPRILSPPKKREEKIRRRQEQEDEHTVFKNAKKKNARR